jgi:hypothetical protein
MRFSLLLYGFYLLLRFTSWKYDAFRTRLEEQDFSMIIRTADGKRARRYVARAGALSSGRGVISGSDFSLVWKDAAAGYRYMSAMKPKALMRAIGDGSLSLEGDAEKVTHFLALFKLMLECNRKKSAG